MRWFNNRIKLIFNIKDPIYKRREKLSKIIYKDFEGVIKYGAFKGLKLTDQHWWSHTDIGSIFFGFYEKEVLNEILKVSSETRKKYFIDIGAADGYYGIGVLIANLFDHSYCFELTQKGQDVIKMNSKLNNVFEKITIKGKLDKLLSNTIPLEIISNSLILMDIEGSEFDLLNDKFLKEIKYSNLIIEIHEHFYFEGKRMLKELKERLREYFYVKEITTQERNLAPFEELDDYTDSDRWLLCSEGRHKKGLWLLLYPKDHARF